MIEPIGRLDDPRLEHYAHVGDHAWLRAHGLFVAEGRLLVRRVLAEWPGSLHSILVSPAALTAVTDVAPQSIPIYVVESRIVEQLTGFDFHRGCLSVGTRPQALDALTVHRSAWLLALEGIANPDNIGGLFRAAAAFGVDGIILDPTCADPLYRKAIRTSMGAVFAVPFARSSGWPSGLAGFIGKGFAVAALTPRGSMRVDDFARSHDGPVILMLGSEGSGLTDAALTLATHLVRIPIEAAVDSLNVTVAAGVALAMLTLTRPSQA